MSKLRTYQLQNPDSATVNIELDQSGGTTVSGILTASSGVVGNVTGTATTATNLADGANITTGTISNDRLPATITKNLTGNVTGNLTGNLESTASLAGISSSISDTAVDVFVYDTRKDSDGGAWRKRTQHTSWYNETLNTSIRGSRREFPAVAVITVIGGTVSSYGSDNGNFKINIYDGDDPDLPLWMEFNGYSNTNSLLRGGQNYPLTSVYALNGSLYFARNGGYGIGLISFIDEKIYSYWDTSGYTIYNGNISQRNSGSNAGGYNGTGIVNATVNDVAMTVLPNAPIDSATGLPVPTIAVATNSGISVIKDDGTVVDTVSNNSGYTFARSVEWSSNNDLLFVMGDGGGGLDYFHTYDGFNTSDNTITIDTKTGSTKNVRSMFRKADVALAYGVHPFDAFTVQGSSVSPDYSKLYVTAKSDAYEYAIRSAQGLTHISENPDSSGSLVSYATTSYATGWLHGDIKGAFLSDTDTTNAVATELHPNGNSDFSSTDVSYISNTSNGTATVTSGQLVLSGGDAGYSDHIITVNTEVGARYVITIDYIARSAANSIGMYVNNSYLNEVNDGAGYQPRNVGASYTWYFTADATTENIDLVAGGTGGATHTFDNWSIKKVEEDRSVNNKGLQVFGTVTKSAVATGAELVAYSGFSASNYLFQPYNSDLQYGSGDFYVMAWAKLPPVSSSFDVIFDRASSSSTGRIFLYAETSNSLARILIYNGTSQFYADGPSMDDNVWHQLVGVRRGDTLSLYFDGEHKSSVACSGSINDTTAFTHIGLQQDGATGDFGGSIALVRTGGSAPSPEQIKKIYEDEKMLFQENAACTLYGSSDAVTALAYDDSTNLLYAGTSSGRSDFQGLRRINNTTTAVTTAMSASNGLVVEQ